MFGPKYWYNFRKKVIIIFFFFNTRHTDFVKDFATFSHLDKVSYLGKPYIHTFLHVGFETQQLHKQNLQEPIRTPAILDAEVQN